MNLPLIVNLINGFIYAQLCLVIAIVMVQGHQENMGGEFDHVGNMSKTGDH